MKNNNRLIVGLGNPGEKYSQTRHNAGFIILDEIQKLLEFPGFVFDKKFNAEVSGKNLTNSSSFLERIFHKNSKIFIIKPHSFMNKSGEVVRKFIDFYKIPLENVIVIHDDLDLSIGNYKISKNSGAGGHNGIQSLINILGTKEFKRIRVGIEQEAGKKFRQIPGDKFVLQKLSEKELDKIKNLANQLDFDMKKQ